jgi:hypothetical protein
LQDGKRSLGPKDAITIEIDDKRYEVDLSKTWPPEEVASAPPNTKERHSEGEVILTIRKPDLLGGSRWQFTHGGAVVSASIKDENWLNDLHGRKIALHSGDALQCKVQFTYVFNENGTMIEQKTDILNVLSVIKGDGGQIPLFPE